MLIESLSTNRLQSENRARHLACYLQLGGLSDNKLQWINRVMNGKSGSKRFGWPGGLYLACPLLLVSLFALNLTLPPTWAVGAFYAAAIVAAIPTWDRRFIREVSLAALLFLLWNAAAHHGGGAGLATVLLHGVLGLLAIGAVMRLSLEIVGAYEQRMRSELARVHAATCICDCQGRMLTMCAWTKRVKDNGRWVTIEEFLDRHFQILVSHGISDDAKANLLAELRQSRRSEQPVVAFDFDVGCNG
jgi:hypothetical protein